MKHHETLTSLDSLVNTLNELAELWKAAYYDSQMLFWISTILITILLILLTYSIILILLWRRKYKMFKKGLLREVVRFLSQHK